MRQSGAFLLRASRDVYSNVFTCDKFINFTKVGFLSDNRRKMVSFYVIFDIIKLEQMIILKYIAVDGGCRILISSVRSIFNLSPLLLGFQFA